MLLSRVHTCAVHCDDPEFKHMTDIGDLPKHRLLEIRRFFEDYKKNENKEVPRRLLRIPSVLQPKWHTRLHASAASATLQDPQTECDRLRLLQAKLPPCRHTSAACAERASAARPALLAPRARPSRGCVLQVEVEEMQGADAARKAIIASRKLYESEYVAKSKHKYQT